MYALAKRASSAGKPRIKQITNNIGDYYDGEELAELNRHYETYEPIFLKSKNKQDEEEDETTVAKYFSFLAAMRNSVIDETKATDVASVISLISVNEIQVYNSEKSQSPIYSARRMRTIPSQLEMKDMFSIVEKSPANMNIYPMDNNTHLQYPVIILAEFHQLFFESLMMCYEKRKVVLMNNGMNRDVSNRSISDMEYLYSIQKHIFQYDVSHVCESGNSNNFGNCDTFLYRENQIYWSDLLKVFLRASGLVTVCCHSGISHYCQGNQCTFFGCPFYPKKIEFTAQTQFDKDYADFEYGLGFDNKELSELSIFTEEINKRNKYRIQYSKTGEMNFETLEEKYAHTKSNKTKNPEMLEGDDDKDDMSDDMDVDAFDDDMSNPDESDQYMHNFNFVQEKTAVDFPEYESSDFVKFVDELNNNGSFKKTTSTDAALEKNINKIQTILISLLKTSTEFVKTNKTEREKNCSVALEKYVSQCYSNNSPVNFFNLVYIYMNYLDLYINREHYASTFMGCINEITCLIYAMLQITNKYNKLPSTKQADNVIYCLNILRHEDVMYNGVCIIRKRPITSLIVDNITSAKSLFPVDSLTVGIEMVRESLMLHMTECLKNSKSKIKSEKYLSNNNNLIKMFSVDRTVEKMLKTSF